MGRPAVTEASYRQPETRYDAPTGMGQDPLRPSRGVATMLSAAFLALALGAVFSLVPLPYAVMSPGPVTDTLGELDGQPIIDIQGEPTHETEGELYFTTVRVLGGPGQRVTLFDVVGAWLDPSRAVYPESELFPQGSTRQQVQEDNAAEMENSQQVAAAVAERALGKDVPVTVTVASVLEGSAADGLIEPGDVIVSVNGQPAESPVVVRNAVRAKAPGDEITVVVQRGGEQVTVTPVAKDNDGVATLGVVMSGQYQLSTDVTIHAGAVGGPSAGMMFSLAIYDLLTDGALPGGKAIAGTGTIADDGSVGPIGGIQQKLVGARSAGAEWFLAPADNCAEVVGHVPEGLRVAKVATFSEALAAVESIAAGTADSLPSCS